MENDQNVQQIDLDRNEIMDRVARLKDAPDGETMHWQSPTGEFLVWKEGKRIYSAYERLDGMKAPIRAEARIISVGTRTELRFDI